MLRLFSIFNTSPCSVSFKTDCVRLDFLNSLEAGYFFSEIFEKALGNINKVVIEFLINFAGDEECGFFVREVNIFIKFKFFKISFIVVYIFWVLMFLEEISGFFCF